MTQQKFAMEVKGLSVSYNGKPAVKGVTFPVIQNAVTALIGRSGCGKSTVIREMNRMNQTIPRVKLAVEGDILYRGKSIYAPGTSVEELRRQVGMVFQQPNPLPKSIFENVVYGPRLMGETDKERLVEIGETALKQAGLWKDVKTDWMKRSGLSLSGGQQQRLCIARTLANKPKVLLFDEATASLDPISTDHIIKLIREELVGKYTIVMVAHDLDVVYDIADYVAFFGITTSEKDVDESDERMRWGELVEYGTKAQVFTSPRDPRTIKYVSQRRAG